jgi:hypothetical protein
MLAAERGEERMETTVELIYMFQNNILTFSHKGYSVQRTADKLIYIANKLAN